MGVNRRPQKELEPSHHVPTQSQPCHRPHPGPTVSANQRSTRGRLHEDLQVSGAVQLRAELGAGTAGAAGPSSEPAPRSSARLVWTAARPAPTPSAPSMTASCAMGGSFAPGRSTSHITSLALLFCFVKLNNKLISHKFHMCNTSNC